ncbi:MAG: crotonase [Gammaproteobacteria bacterium]|nr:MAG: crotonase [Gammaproteobacteria bacterium]
MNRQGTHWRYARREDGFGELVIDVAGRSANVLTPEVLEELLALLEAVREDAPPGLVLRSGKPSGFIAGADVHRFAPLPPRDEVLAFIHLGQRAADALEALPFPTLALVRGFCLGGGLELALACDYRIACDDERTRLGLPEVRLGIHPGFGGTARLVRLLGSLPALQLMLTGRTLRARPAQRVGLVDQAVPERLLEVAAAELLRRPPAKHRPSRWARWSALPPVRPVLGAWLHRQVARKAPRRHYPAPHALIDLWVRHGGRFRDLLAAEAESVADLVTGETAQNLVRVFFLQERLKGLAKGREHGIAHVHVVGAGVMGGDIAAWCALRGLRVTLQDQDPERIAAAVGRAAALFRKRLRDPRRVTAALDRLVPDPDAAFAGHADLVVEAIFEDREAKRRLYAVLEPRLKPEALLATNTSSIPLEELATVLQRPERLIGLHFFNPVAKMQLVEVVRGAHADPGAIERGLAFVRALDRLPLPVASRPGFLVNRVLMPYLLEAVELVEEGVPPELVDHAARDFGMPMGPIELADTVGLDICLHVAEILGEAFGLAVPDRLRALVEDGRVGRKRGRGFYTWRRGKPMRHRLPRPDPARLGELQERLVDRMLNEAVACLREGVVADADLLDAGMIFGTGFAPFRGGPMHYAQTRGVEDLETRMHDLAARYGARFLPDDGWNRLRRQPG